jgi:subtilase family serine protease
MDRSIVSLFLAAALAGTCAIPASSQTASPTAITPPSSIANPGDAGVRAHTNLQIWAVPLNSAPNASGPPFPGNFYQTPASLACIYGFQPLVPGCNPNVVTANPGGGSHAIAIVDAYDNPNAYEDLQNFSTQFGVTAITPSSFQVVYAPPGGTAPGSCTGAPVQPASALLYGWDIEESLDVQYAHAMAPLATIYLVEAQSNYDSDLYCAGAVASELVAAAGGGEVSMSWGGGEYMGENSNDVVFQTPSVVYFAATGDGPGVIYPSASPHVVAVGGTSLSFNSSTGSFLAENSWQSGGGGVSAFEPKPGYQAGFPGISGPGRHVPDIAADANLFTGVWVLDTLYGPGTWFIVGGTSVATPLMAGIVNAAGSFAASSVAELRNIYGSSGAGFTDITYGNCGPYMGTFAKAGWDACTGLGSPKGYSHK